jgi:hypothetical protein
VTTEAQVEANRQNAQKSTGPKTPEGKAAVSQNALKHGLFAVQDVLTTENQAEFDLMRDEMLAELAPVGVVESLLARRAVNLAWRLKRAERMQSEAIEDMIEYQSTSPPTRESTRLGCQADGVPGDHPSVQQDHLTLGRVAVHDWSNDKALEQMFNYERRIEHSLYKTMGELRAVQKMRQTTEAAEAQARADSAKQSRSELTPEEEIAVAKRIYGDPLPQWVVAKFKEIGITVDDVLQVPEPSEPAAALQSQDSASETDAALSLLNL